MARDARLARLRRPRRRAGDRRPHPGDRRRRLPAGRVRPAPTALVDEAGLDEPDLRERADHRPGRRQLDAGRGRGRRGRAGRRPRRASRASTRWPSRSGARTGRRCWSPPSWPGTRKTSAPLQDVTDAGRPPSTRTWRSARPATCPSTTRSASRSPRTSSAAEGISLPVTLVLMLIAFGALIAAGIPVLLAATSVAATIGITAPLSHLVHAEPTVSSMIVLIGMAVGVDYSLFYLKREREERAKGATTLDAVEIAAATSGHSIVVSGLRRDRLDGRAVRLRRRHLQLARHRLDPGGRDRRARLDHRAARAAGQARPLGGPSAGAAAVAAQPPDRPRRDQQPHPGPVSAARSRPWSSPALAVAALGAAGVRHEAPGGEPRHAAATRSPRCTRSGRWPTPSRPRAPPRTVVVKADADQPGRRTRCARRPGGAGDRERRVRGHPRRRPGLRGRPDQRAAARAAVRRVRPARRGRGRHAARRPGAAGAGRPRRASTPSAATPPRPATSSTGCAPGCRS